jgi:hypothetical protein
MADNIDPTLKFKESIVKDKEFGEAGWKESFEIPATHNKLYTRLLKEGLYRDVAGALGHVQDIVWAAAFPNLISRSMIKTIQTSQMMERFPKEYIPYAFDTNEGPAMKTGRRAEFQDVTANNEIKIAQSWSESFVEDASWDNLSWQIEGNGRAIARKELAKVVAMYNGIASGSLATGAEITVTDKSAGKYSSTNGIQWEELQELINAVEQANFVPDVVAMPPKQFGSLRCFAQFTSSLYTPGPAKTGGNMPPIGVNQMRSSYYSTLLDILFVTSTEITKCLAIDTKAAAVLLERRPLTSKPYEVPDDNAFGVYSSERIGMDVLRAAAVARGSH